MKVARADGDLSCSLIALLRDPEAFSRYVITLSRLRSDAWFGEHCVRVWAITRSGAYTSEFITGVNLAVLRDTCLTSYDPTWPAPQALRRALGSLMAHLSSYYDAHGYLIGDWSLHNLTFSSDRLGVINVDAEGFFSYDSETRCVENHFPSVMRNLRGFCELLKVLDDDQVDAVRALSVLRLIDQVRRAEEQYSAIGFAGGYHSLVLDGRHFSGQRDCVGRLAAVPFDFKDKVVIDFGCNVGGMLHAIADVAAAGYGFDRTSHCVNAATAIAAFNRRTNVAFFSFDFDVDNLALLPAFVAGRRPDICFVLSICRWLTRWRDVLSVAAEMADAMLFETNGSASQQAEQLHFVTTLFGDVMKVDGGSDDDPSAERATYLCRQRL